MGKGLAWNGASATDPPAVFLPVTITASGLMLPTRIPDPDTLSYEVIGRDACSGLNNIICSAPLCFTTHEPASRPQWLYFVSRRRQQWRGSQSSLHRALEQEQLRCHERRRSNRRGHRGD